MVHVKDISVSETFDIFVEGNELLDVAVLTTTEDWVVDHDAIDTWVGVRFENGIF